MLTTSKTSLLESYRSQISTYDEVIDAHGHVKPHWKNLFNTLEQIGINELNLRNEEIKRKLKENGVTYNVYDAANGENRQWQLDPIPFLITHNEWLDIERGLIQRAKVLDLIFKDLYGSRKLIKDKIIPSELLFANSGFYRQCFDTKIQSEHQLIMYAADIARGPDGRMWVLDNRTQSPSGSGYALENRSVLSRQLPELAKNMYVNKLSPYFYSIQQTINRLPSSLKDDPFVVYLTPGAMNETYFEHSYLSSYLGYTLAQGEDLLVRDGYVWLRSIEGLHKVDVIIRRVDDEFIDPLELRKDSKLGIPGLLQVVRNGNVSIINPPSTSLLENHAFMAFLNNASKYLIGEELILPSVATWWCGQSKELNFVLNNLDKLIIKKANRNEKFRSIYGGRLSKNEQEGLKALIIKSPQDFVAQEEVSLSTTPSFTGNGIEPRYASMRAFLISNDSSYYVMKGGLTRSSPEKDKFIISGQYGGISKDTWIVTDHPQEVQEKLFVSNNLTTRKEIVLSSRSAENLFWVGRYSERTLIITRTIINLINTLNIQKNFADMPKDEHITILLKALSHLTLTYPGFLDEDHAEKLKNPYPELHELITNVNKVGSVAYNIDHFLMSISSVRERWTIGTWRVVDLIQNIQQNIKNLDKENVYAGQRTLEKLHTRIFTFYGIVNETMSKEHALNLFELGKLFERCIMLISQMRSCICYKLDEQVEHEILEFLLYNNYSLVSYRSKYKSEVKIEPYLDMVLFESKLPHSMVHMLDSISSIINKLPQNSNNNRLNEVDKALLEACAMVKLSNVPVLAACHAKSLQRRDLDLLLSKLYDKVSQAYLGISSMYFTHTGGIQSFSDKAKDNSLDEI